MHHGTWVEPEGHSPSAAGQRRPGRIVGIHHLYPVRREQAIQPQLGGEVGFHGAVIVQVIAGKVGEDPRGEAQAVEAALVQAVGAGLHDHTGHPAPQHGGEGRLEVDRSRRGQRARGGFDRASRPIEGAQGPDAPGVARVVEQVPHQRRGGGLAVGPGDAHQREAGPRVAVPGAAHHEGGAAAVLHHHAGHGDAVWPLHDHGRRPPRHGVGHEAVPVGLGAAHRDVDHAGRDRATVGGDAREGRRGAGAGREQAGTPQGRLEGRKGLAHLTPPTGSRSCRSQANPPRPAWSGAPVRSHAPPPGTRAGAWCSPPCAG